MIEKKLILFLKKDKVVKWHKFISVNIVVYIKSRIYEIRLYILTSKIDDLVMKAPFDVNPKFPISGSLQADAFNIYIDQR